MEITIKKTFNITDEQLDEIMCTALEGGITYWCDEAKVVGDYLGEYAHEQIARGGQLILSDSEEGKTYELNKEKLLKGLELYLTNGGDAEIASREIVDTAEVAAATYEYTIDTCEVDAVVADEIVQYALFGDVIYEIGRAHV